MTKIQQGSFSADESHLFKVVYVRLSALLHASQSVVADAVDSAVSDSPNGRARTAHRWDAFEQVNHLLYSAEDHLRTMRIVLEAEFLPTYALFSLLRAAAEAVVSCAYLLDDSLSDTARMARGLNVRWENLEEQRKLTGDASQFAARVAILEERAARNGIQVFKVDPAKPATDFGERRLSEIALFSKYITPEKPDPNADKPIGELVYRYLSGHVHSAIWVKIANAEITATDEPGMSTVKLDLQFDWLALMLRMILRRHESNIVSLLALSGYPVMVWHEALKSGTADGQKGFVRLADRQAAGPGS